MYNESLENFKAILRKDYGVALNNFQATELADNFLLVLETVLTPLPSKSGLTKPKERSKNDS